MYLDFLLTTIQYFGYWLVVQLTYMIYTGDNRWSDLLNVKHSAEDIGNVSP